MSTNFIPFSGAESASGGVLIPPEQGEILVNGILVETGALQLAGDIKSTTARKTKFPIWLGRPTAGPVGEGAPKPVTGAGFGSTELNIKKFATTVIFTDEQIEDLQNGDLNVLVDAGVRQALSVAIDAYSVGASGGASLKLPNGPIFDSTLLGLGGAGVTIAAQSSEEKEGKVADTRLQKAVSAALGVLEENGYGNPADIGVLLGFGFQQQLRDARDAFGRPLYDGGTFGGQSIDPLYGLARAHSTNLVAISATAQVFTGTTAVGSKLVKITVRGTVPIVVGQPISGAGIPVGTTVLRLIGNVGEETEVELSANATAAATVEITVKRPVGIVAHRPNIHARLRQDVVVRVSNEATIENESEKYNLFQDNLHAVLYETRLGYLVHDGARAIVPIWA